MQLVAIDILDSLPESNAGNTYILVAGDYFTRWKEAYAIPNQEAVTVAQKLVDEYFCHFSPPEQLQSNLDHQFESEVIKRISRSLHIEKIRTTPYHPQSNGLMECFKRTLESILATCVKEHPFQWEEHLKKGCFAYNSSIQAATGFSPYYLMFGRQAKLPIDLMYGGGDHVEKVRGRSLSMFATLECHSQKPTSMFVKKWETSRSDRKELY